MCTRPGRERKARTPVAVVLGIFLGSLRRETLGLRVVISKNNASKVESLLSQGPAIDTEILLLAVSPQIIHLSNMVNDRTCEMSRKLRETSVPSSEHYLLPRTP